MQSSRERRREKDGVSEREKSMMENGVGERDSGIFLALSEKDASDAGC